MTGVRDPQRGPIMSELEDEAKEAAAGLRELADFIETHPEFAPGVTGTRFYDFEDDADEWRARVKTLGGRREKAANTSFFGVTRKFGPVEVYLYTGRDQVCEAKVVGQETVEVPDPEAPKITVTRDVIEWECPPSISDSRDSWSGKTRAELYEDAGLPPTGAQPHPGECDAEGDGGCSICQIWGDDQ